MKRVLFDSTAIIDFIRNDPDVVDYIKRYLDQHDELTFSTLTKYEILRGYEVLEARKKQAAFLVFCDDHEVLSLSDEIIQKAAAIYGDLHRKGQLIGDADILIAATALFHQLPVLTENTRHFKVIDGLVLADYS